MRVNTHAQEYIAANWLTESDRYMAGELNTTRDNVAHIRLRLGLRRTKEQAQALQPKTRIHSQALREYIAEWWEQDTDALIANHWEIPRHIVANHRRRMGFYRGMRRS